MLVHWKALFANATQWLLNMMDSHPAMSQNALNKHWVGVPNDWSLMIPMVLVLTDYFKVSISTTRLAFQQPDYSTELLLLEEILQHLLSTKTLWTLIYILHYQQVFSQDFFHQPYHQQASAVFSRPNFRGEAPSVLHRRPRSRDGPWKAQSPAVGRYGVSIYLWDPVGHLKLKVHTCIIHIYINKNIYTHTAINIYIYDLAKKSCLYVAYLW